MAAFRNMAKFINSLADSMPGALGAAMAENPMGLMEKIDTALAEPDAFAKNPQKAGELSRQRAELEQAIASAEEEWLEYSAEYETVSGA